MVKPRPSDRSPAPLHSVMVIVSLVQEAVKHLPSVNLLQAKEHKNMTYHFYLRNFA